jgi:hypothetical protein
MQSTTFRVRVDGIMHKLRDCPEHPDPEFIAHARADVPWLLEQIELLKAANDTLANEVLRLGGSIDGGK